MLIARKPLGPLPLAVLVSACLAGCAGDAGPEGQRGPAGAGVALRTERIGAGAACAAGGLRVEVGVDDDADGVLDAAEVDATTYVCDGASGAGVLAEAEPPGANCALGGVRLTAGTGAPTYVCTGASGAAGAPGESVTATPEPPGASCTEGGIRLQVGAGAPTYVCAGAPGADGRGVAMTPEAPGPNCPHGGQRLQVGTEPPAYACNGAPGEDGEDVTMTPEPPGEHCPFGGVRLQVGAGVPRYVCSGAPGGTARPSVVTVGAGAPGYTEVTIQGEVTDGGGELVLARGVVLSTAGTPTLGDVVRFASPGAGPFEVRCDGLAPATTHHVRAFATNALGTTFGEVISVTTRPLAVPALSTLPAENVTATSALSGGEVTDGGGTPILARGLCWSTAPDPAPGGDCAAEGAGEGRFLARAHGLVPETLYHVRAYATNAQGTGYGAGETFTTGALPLAAVRTAAATAISYRSATSGGEVLDDQGSPVTSRGVCWSVAPAPTTADACFTEAGGLGAFPAPLAGLAAATTYHVRAFAVNGGGTSYGDEVRFTTLAPSAPQLTTRPVAGISSHVAGSGGLVVTDGGAAITAKGVCWSLNPAPTTLNACTNDGAGPAGYNSTLSPLEPLTAYHARAYATNALGTGYGQDVAFTTTDLATPGPAVPVVGTASTAMATRATATSGGYVSSDGGSAVIARGVCWGPSPAPTFADSCTADGEGVGFFTSTLTGLGGCGTVYHVRAYATNATGTGWGGGTTVSTGLLATVETAPVEPLTTEGGVGGGTVADDGGCPVTARGLVWSWNPGPALGATGATAGEGTGAFAVTIAGLLGNRTHYVRAYATNAAGTAYGAQEVFTTLTPPTPYVGQLHAGGIVFHVDASGQHGLVVSTADQGYAAWGCQNTSIPTSSAFGAGPTNTATIVASCAAAGTAARVADGLTLNGYGDWFLPSIEELAAMRTALHLQGLGGFGTYTSYLSSTERTAAYAYQLDMYGGNWGGYAGKNSAYPFRVMRAF